MDTNGEVTEAPQAVEKPVEEKPTGTLSHTESLGRSMSSNDYRTIYRRGRASRRSHRDVQGPVQEEEDDKEAQG